jgi:hypothetical protein
MRVLTTRGGFGGPAGSVTEKVPKPAALWIFISSTDSGLNAQERLPRSKAGLSGGQA